MTNSHHHHVITTVTTHHVTATTTSPPPPPIPHALPSTTCHPQRQEWAQVMCLASFGPVVHLFFFMFSYILIIYIILRFYLYFEDMRRVWVGGKLAMTKMDPNVFFFFVNNPSVLGPTYEMTAKTREMT